MTNLAKLVVSLEAQSAGYERKLGTAQKKLAWFERKQKKTLGNIKTAFAGLAASISIGLLVNAGRNALNLADNIQKIGIRTGATTEFLSQLKFAAEQSGVSFEGLTKSISLMQDNTVEAVRGMKAQKQAFDDLNINARTFMNLSVEDQFHALADALMRVDNQAHRVNIARDIFGRSGAEFLQMAKDGADGIRVLQEEAHKLGVTLSQEDADAAAEAKDAMNRLDNAVSALTRNLTTSFAPGLSVVFNWMAENVPKAINTARQALQDLSRDLSDFDAGPKELQEKLEKAKQELGALLQLKARQQNPEAYDAQIERVDLLIDKLEDLLSISEMVESKGVVLPGFNIEDSTGGGGIPDVGSGPAAGSLLELPKKKEFDSSSLDEANTILDGIVEQTHDKANTISSILSTSLISGMSRGAEGMQDVFKDMLANLAMQMAQAAITDMLFSVMGGVGGAPGGLSSVFPGFATGGSFTVGGQSGVDNNLVAFRATRGEQVSIRTPSQQQGGGGGDTVFNIGNVESADDFTTKLRQATLSGELPAVLNEFQRQMGGNPVHEAF